MKDFIQFEHVSKKYKENLALDDVSFSIKRGRCIGLIGVNGAGKTTTLKILSGLLKPSNGKITFDGKTVDTSVEFKKNIGYLSQYPKFYDWMTGLEFLSYVGDLYGLLKEKKAKRIEEVLQTVKLTDSQHKKIKGYSGGMRQRLGIAQAILHQPIFLILDEPVSALDPEGRYQIIQLLQELKKETTILLSTHILHDADSICDDVILLHHGKKLIETELMELKKVYREPVIKITFENSIKDIEALLQPYSWIEDVSKHSPFEVSLRVGEKDIALKTLPSILIDHGFSFSSIQVSEPSLEDIFLKLVRNS